VTECPRLSFDDRQRRRRHGNAWPPTNTSGLGQIVEEDYVAAQTKLTYLDGSGNVTGLDRFGRIVDQVWKDYSTTPASVVDEYHLTSTTAPAIARPDTTPLETDGSLR